MPLTSPCWSLIALLPEGLGSTGHRSREREAINGKNVGCCFQSMRSSSRHLAHPSLGQSGNAARGDGQDPYWVKLRRHCPSSTGHL